MCNLAVLHCCHILCVSTNIHTCLPPLVLHALGEHAAVLGVEVGGVVSDGLRVVEVAMRGRAHSVTKWRRGPPEEWPITATNR